MEGLTDSQLVELEKRINRGIPLKPAEQRELVAEVRRLRRIILRIKIPEKK
jgi:hypothetical protein